MGWARGVVGSWSLDAPGTVGTAGVLRKRTACVTPCGVACTMRRSRRTRRPRTPPTRPARTARGEAPRHRRALRRWQRQTPQTSGARWSSVHEHRHQVHARTTTPVSAAPRAARVLCVLVRWLPTACPVRARRSQPARPKTTLQQRREPPSQAASVRAPPLQTHTRSARVQRLASLSAASSSPL